MPVNEHIAVRGCITQEKYIKGRSLSEIEDILGFHKGRLSTGMKVAVLEHKPTTNDFDFLGYSNVAGHNFNQANLDKLNVAQLKKLVVEEVFTTSGPDRLIKVLPVTGHSNDMSNDDQYPSGLGAPQWKLTTPIQARVIAEIGPKQKFS